MKGTEEIKVGHRQISLWCEQSREYESTGLDPEMAEEWFLNWLGSNRIVLSGGHLPTASPAIPEPDSRCPYGGVITVQQGNDGRKRKNINEKPVKQSPMIYLIGINIVR